MAIVYKTSGICKVHPLTSVKISLVSMMHKCGNKTEGSQNYFTAIFSYKCM